MGGFFLKSWPSVCLHGCQKLKKEFSFICARILLLLLKALWGFIFFQNFKVGDLSRNAKLREIVFTNQQ